MLSQFSTVDFGTSPSRKVFEVEEQVKVARGQVRTEWWMGGQFFFEFPKQLDASHSSEGLRVFMQQHDTQSQ